MFALFSTVTLFYTIKHSLLPPPPLHPKNPLAMYTVIRAADGDVTLDPCINHGHVNAGKYFSKGAIVEVGI